MEVTTYWKVQDLIDSAGWLSILLTDVIYLRNQVEFPKICISYFQ